MSQPDAQYPRYRSHFLPRTRNGWITAIAFLVLLALAEPPLVYVLANRITPWVFGMPFLFAYLLGLYLAMIAVLIWAALRGV
jgi:hypothetical protein